MHFELLIIKQSYKYLYILLFFCRFEKESVNFNAKMSRLQKYIKSVGRDLANAASTIGDNSESYDLLDTLSPYILCSGFGNIDVWR